MSAWWVGYMSAWFCIACRDLRCYRHIDQGFFEQVINAKVLDGTGSLVVIVKGSPLVGNREHLIYVIGRGLLK